MSYEGRIYNSREELKNGISPEKLSKMHWNNFAELENLFNLHPEETLPAKKSYLDFLAQKDAALV